MTLFLIVGQDNQSTMTI